MAAIIANLQNARLSADAGDFIPYTPEEFARFCADYPDLRTELTPLGELVIMPPAGDESSLRNADLTADLVIWNRTARLGKVFDSSAGFLFPNGAIRSPDASWVAQPRWDALPAEQRGRFSPLAPGFVVELLSPTDRLSTTQAKMREYMENGVRLGWLINPRDKTVELSGIGREVEVLTCPSSLSGEDVLPGFILDLTSIWQ